MQAWSKQFFLFICFCLSLNALAATRVELFSPEGSAKAVRQVIVRFSEPVVAFGDLRLEDPFDINCPAAGQGRWVDGRNWSYDFQNDLPAGLRCSFTLRADLKDLAGLPLIDKQTFSFSTGGPSIVHSVPRQLSTIDENQMFILALDAIPRLKSITDHASCRAEGINEKIGVRIISGKVREQLLTQRKDFVDRYLQIYFQARGQVWQRQLKMTDQQLGQVPIVILQCKQTLPAGAAVSLVWGAGIMSESGLSNDKAQKWSYKSRNQFTARFSCTKTNAAAQCVPFMPMRLDFNAPVALAQARMIRLTDAQGKSFAPIFDKEERKTGYINALDFKADFPEKQSLSLQLPAKLTDDAGRSLVNQSAFPMTVKTDELPPLAKFPARFGLLEANGDRALPVTLRNLEANLPAHLARAGSTPIVKGGVLQVKQSQIEDQDKQILKWLGRLGILRFGEVDEQVDLSKSVFGKNRASKEFTLPKPAGEGAFEVVGIPLPEAGFYVVELESPRLGAALNKKGGTAYVHSAALVTNLAAHIKYGVQSSLVWVTTLDKGKPVDRALVTVRDCKGKVIWRGKTDTQGIAHINQKLDVEHCGFDTNLFVSARSGADMTFTLSSWSGGIQSWRFGVPTGESNQENLIVNTVFDRSLLRSGETVHMKHFLRQRTGSGFSMVKKEAVPDKLQVVHQGSDQTYEFPLTWSGGQTAETAWTIPADAKQGVYFTMIGGRIAGKFRVEVFRVPTMRAQILGPKTPSVQAESVALDLQLNFLSGGPAANAPVKLRTLVSPKNIEFSDYPDFNMNAGDIAEGTINGEQFFNDEEYLFNSVDDQMHDPARTQSLVLDRVGAARVLVDQLPRSDEARELLAELEYQDANGETLTSSAKLVLWSSNRLIGIKAPMSAVRAEGFTFEVVVLDLEGHPVAQAPVAIDFFEDRNYSHRRRLIGGFYAYENTRVVKQRGVACSGNTNDKGLLTCNFKPAIEGDLILRASTVDSQGNVAYTNRSVGVGGNAEQWFDAKDSDRIDVLPEKKLYQPGEMATMQVRMPFRNATALVTVEREGVLDTYVQQISGKDSQISIPIKGNYAPNVYVSVFLVRGRIGGIKPTALLDLGKPAYKMGLAQLRVGWQSHQLDVSVTTDQRVYKSRGKVQVQIKVKRADGSPMPKHAEVAVAAVDVGLLDLLPNASWNLLESMMQQRSLQVETSTAQMQVIGKRHFGRKAVPHGGGGGSKDGVRELFETLLFWRARIELDENGESVGELTLNDSATEFRIVAIASAEAGLFGTGKTDIRSTQDLLILSGLPEVVREGDRMRAGFTLRNTSELKQRLAVGARFASGSAKEAASQKLKAQELILEPGQAQEIFWDVRIPFNVTSLVWDVDAHTSNADGEIETGDKLRIRQSVTPAIPVRTYQSTLMQIDKSLTLPIQMPAGALAGRGGVNILLSPRLGGDLPAVQEYMRLYPYTCFEQNASKAIALHDVEMWKKSVDSLPVFLDNDGLLKYFPMMERGSDTLTAYILSIADEAGYALPPAAKSRMQAALIAFVEGRVTRNAMYPTTDLDIRKIAALEALSRSDLVTPMMLDSINMHIDIWPTSTVIDWYLVLQRSLKLKNREVNMAQAEQVLRTRLNFQGSRMGFSTERTDDLWWLMTSADVNANRVLLAMLDNPRWRDDLPRLAAGTLGRQIKGRWQTTVANAWGVLAMDKFSTRFEAQPMTGNSQVALGTTEKSVDWNQTPKGGTLSFAWPDQTKELRLQHQGNGKPWVTLQSLAAIPLTAPLSTAYQIKKTFIPVEQKKPGVWSQGDVIRVHLDLDAQTDMSWVVVDDPIVTGASILGTGLGKDSQIMTREEKREGWVWPAFEERGAQAFRAYYEFVPKGKWSVDYTMRINLPGEFGLPSTRVEAMYAPEMMGEIPNPKIVVQP